MRKIERFFMLNSLNLKKRMLKVISGSDLEGKILGGERFAV